MDQNLLLNHLFQENNTILKQHLLLKGLQKEANCGEVLGTIDPEKLLLRSALVEKSQEVLQFAYVITNNIIFISFIRYFIIFIITKVISVLCFSKFIEQNK